MELLQPTALALAGLLPVLIVPYLLRRRAERRVVSSLLGYTTLGTPSSPRRIGLPRLTPFFFLQLLALSLLVMAAAAPVWHRAAPRHAIVLDTSIRMRTQETPDTPSSGAEARFAAARRDARRLAGRTDTPALFVTAPAPRGIAVGRADVVAALDQLVATEAAGPTAPELGDFLAVLLGDYDRVTLIGDYEVTDPRVTTIRIGTPLANRAIAAVAVHRTLFAPGQLTIGGRIENFGRPASIELVLEERAASTPSRTTGSPGESASAAGRPNEINSRQQADAHAAAVADRAVARIPLLLAASGETPFTFTVTTAARAFQLRIEPADALSADDVAWLVAPPSKPLDLLVVSSQSDAAATLRRLPGTRVRVISPEDYESTDTADVTVFHLTAPTTAFDGSALLIMPPAANGVVPTADTPAPATIVDWSSESPLTQSVNFRMIRPAMAIALQPRPGWRTVAMGAPGPLVAVREDSGRRLAALGFDLLPYVGRANLPVSILTLNLLAWLAQSGTVGPVPAGFPLALPEDATAVITPAGVKRPAAHPFTATGEAGLYRILRAPTGSVPRAGLEAATDDPAASPDAAAPDHAAARPPPIGPPAHDDDALLAAVAPLVASDLRRPVIVRVASTSEGTRAPSSSTVRLLTPALVTAALALVMLDWRRRES